MSDYPRLISNKLHSFRNFGVQSSWINSSMKQEVITISMAKYML